LASLLLAVAFAQPAKKLDWQGDERQQQRRLAARQCHLFFNNVEVWVSSKLAHTQLVYWVSNDY
jgi:hypothetical protein